MTPPIPFPSPMALTAAPHPQRAAFLARAQALNRAWDRPGTWELFRCIDPRYSSAADIVSGAGARHAAGRWHPPGSVFALSYTAAEPETALAETLSAPRYYHLPLSDSLPRVLVSLRLSAVRVLDLREGTLRQRLRLSLGVICQTDWRRENRRGAEAVTQAWGVAWEAAGFEAVIVPSSARRSGVNALVFPANLLAGGWFEVARKVEWP